MPGVMFYYLQQLDKIREVARSKGYAIGLHGSMERDFDLMAVPWIEEASSAEDLVEAVRSVLDGFIDESRTNHNPTFKPHGRLAWSIILHGGGYVDFSVMPRRDNG